MISSEAIIPFLIETSETEFICSWSGETIKNVCETLFINRQLGLHYGLSEGAQVHVSISPNQILPATSVVISPLTSDGWDVLEVGSMIVERKLLNQISIVRPGFIFPLYISNSVWTYVKILSTVPSSVVHLQQFTEAHLIPFDPVKCDPSKESDYNKVSFLEKGRENPASGLSCDWQSGLTSLLSKFNLKFDDMRPSSKMVKPHSEKSLKTVKHFERELQIHPILGMSALLDGHIHVAGVNHADAQCHSILPPYQAFINESCLKSEENCIKTSATCFAQIVVPRKNTSKDNQEESTEFKLVIQMKVLPREVWQCLFGNKNSVMANPILLEQLQIESGTVVLVNCYHQHVETLQGIVLHCNPSTADTEKLKQLCLLYLRRCLFAAETLLLNQGTLLKFSLNDDIKCEIIVELIGILNSVCGLLTRKSLDEIFVTITEDELGMLPHSSKFVEVVNDRILCHDNLVDETIRKIDLSLHAFLHCTSGRPTIRNYQHIGLITGQTALTSTGCGKTSFIRAVQKCITSYPYQFNTEFINCVELRGKTVENIHKHLEKLFEKCCKCEPSVIFFDDLDELIPNVDPAEEGNAMELRSEHLSNTFCGFIEKIRNEERQIHVLVTISCKDMLHPNLLPSSNTHLFTDFVCLTRGSQSCLDILRKCLESQGETNKMNESINYETIQNRMDGFSVSDMNIILQRTINKKMTNKDGSFIVDVSDFEETLKEFKSPSMHCTNLHKPKPQRWSDVGGLEAVKTLLKEALTWPAIYPELLSGCPLKLNSGLLLYGAPGTAKTLLATVVAYESKMNFISVKGPELLSKYVGSSETNVRDLFARAQAAKPCVIFFDELDSFAPRRGHDNTGVTDRVVNQLLTQLDGVEGLDGVFVLAATSRPDLIDPALLRPGRLDRSVKCELPSQCERHEILEILTKDLKLERNVDLQYLAQVTENFSGADLKALLFNAQVENAHNVIKSIGEGSPPPRFDITLGMENFQKALKVTKPSVTKEERDRFNRIFEEFGRNQCKKSSGGNTKILQRITLA